MNMRPDYVTENWLRCLGLTGKAAKAVMDVHTDQLNTARADKARLDFLAELVKLPTASFHFSDDASEEEMPVGFTIRVEESCLPAVQATGADFRLAIDKFKRAMECATATANHGN